MLQFITEGKLDVNAFVPKKKYETIKDALFNKSFDSLSELKYLLGEEFSYNEIRAVMNHVRSLNEADQKN
jgi:hypothetical protein